jgi:hypothetical protein
MHVRHIANSVTWAEHQLAWKISFPNFQKNLKMGGQLVDRLQSLVTNLAGVAQSNSESGAAEIPIL